MTTEREAPAGSNYSTPSNRPHRGTAHGRDRSSTTTSTSAFNARSHRGTQFRQWATARLAEYLVKGVTMDDQRRKNPPGPGQRDYFDELLDRIRDIRACERRFYQKVLDIF